MFYAGVCRLHYDIRDINAFGCNLLIYEATIVWHTNATLCVLKEKRRPLHIPSVRSILTVSASNSLCNTLFNYTYNTYIFLELFILYFFKDPRGQRKLFIIDQAAFSSKSRICI